MQLAAQECCKFQFGDHAIIHIKGDDGVKPCGEDAVHLRPTGSSKEPSGFQAWSPVSGFAEEGRRLCTQQTVPSNAWKNLPRSMACLLESLSEVGKETQLCSIWTQTLDDDDEAYDASQRPKEDKDGSAIDVKFLVDERNNAQDDNEQESRLCDDNIDSEVHPTKSIEPKGWPDAAGT